MTDTTMTKEMEDRKVTLELLSKLKHDVRSPFVIMQSFINILEIHNFNCKPEELKVMTRTFERSVKKAISQVETTFSKLENSAL